MPAAELIARLYLRYGLSLFEHLHGGFSFAMWDEKSQRLCLAIDRIGIKTLYWRREDDRLLFASRAGAIRMAQNEPLVATVGAVGDRAEIGDALAVGLDHGGVHPVKRGAAHQPNGTNHRHSVTPLAPLVCA